ncbi:MAG: VanZ family protein [Bifidobacteriaceae bacterium]|jgi:glycopeptide antibiotics resistance protein|nr:VanZ family protein [Bifidobacteriaceae bacterium]
MRPSSIEREEPVAPEYPLRGGGRALLAGLFAVYIVLLAWIVVWKLEVPFTGTAGLRHVKLVPFAASGADTASNPLEVIVNVLLFMPLGVYLGLLAPSWRWWKPAGAIAGSSLALETAQYALAVGSTDVTDAVSNTAGGLVGLALLALAGRRLGAGTVRTMTRICLVGTVLAVLACGAFFASPVHYR